MNMDEKFFDECERSFFSAVSARIDNRYESGTFEIQYNAKPVPGALARILYNFALSCGFEPKYSEKPRFNSSRQYTFIIENFGGTADFISVVRVTPRSKKEIKRRFKKHGAEEERR